MKNTDDNIKIDKIKKAKNGKVIVRCGTKEQRNQIKNKLNDAKNKLKVEDLKNKNPLIIIKYIKA